MGLCLLSFFPVITCFINFKCKQGLVTVQNPDAL